MPTGRSIAWLTIHWQETPWMEPKVLFQKIEAHHRLYYATRIATSYAHSYRMLTDVTLKLIEAAPNQQLHPANRNFSWVPFCDLTAAQHLQWRSIFSGFEVTKFRSIVNALRGAAEINLS